MLYQLSKDLLSKSSSTVNYLWADFSETSVLPLLDLSVYHAYLRDTHPAGPINHGITSARAHSSLQTHQDLHLLLCKWSNKQQGGRECFKGIISPSEYLFTWSVKIKLRFSTMWNTNHESPILNLVPYIKSVFRELFVFLNMYLCNQIISHGFLKMFIWLPEGLFCVKMAESGGELL